MLFYQTITRLYAARADLRPSLLRSLLRMTFKAPILFDLVAEFVKDMPEALEVLSKKYQIHYEGESVFSLMIQAN
jgi:DnaJ-domain-containing protein 1